MSGEQGPHAEGKGMRAIANAPGGRRSGGREIRPNVEAAA